MQNQKRKCQSYGMQTPPPPKKKCNMPLGLEDRRTSSKKSIVSQGGFESKISNCTFKDYNLQNNFDITGQNK